MLVLPSPSLLLLLVLCDVGVVGVVGVGGVVVGVVAVVADDGDVTVEVDGFGRRGKVTRPIPTPSPAHQH